MKEQKNRKDYWLHEVKQKLEVIFKFHLSIFRILLSKL